MAGTAVEIAIVSKETVTANVQVTSYQDITVIHVSRMRIVIAPETLGSLIDTKHASMVYFGIRFTKFVTGRSMSTALSALKFSTYKLLQPRRLAPNLRRQLPLLLSLQRYRFHPMATGTVVLTVAMAIVILLARQQFQMVSTVM
jgi:ABC-type uncharacterized transport system permease subunit